MYEGNIKMLDNIGYKPKTEVVIEVSDGTTLLISEYVRVQHHILSQFKKETGLWNNNLVMIPILPSVVGDVNLASWLEVCYLVYKESYMDNLTSHDEDYIFRLPIKIKSINKEMNTPTLENSMDFNRLTSNTVWVIFNHDKLVSGILEVYAFCQMKIKYDNLITPVLEACNFVQTDNNFASFRGEEIMDTLTVASAIHICNKECVFSHLRVMLPLAMIDEKPIYPQDTKNRFKIDRILAVRSCPSSIKMNDSSTLNPHWDLDYVYELAPSISAHRFNSSTIYGMDRKTLEEICSLIYPGMDLSEMTDNVSTILLRWLRNMNNSSGIYTVDKHTGEVTSLLTFVITNDKPIMITSIHSKDDSVERILSLFIKKIAYVHNVKPFLAAVLPVDDKVVKDYFSLGFYATMVRFDRIMYTETFDEILLKRI